MDNKNRFRFAYEIRESAEDEAEIMLYSEIVQYKWSKDDPDMTASDFDKLLKEAKATGASKLRLRINCPGGSVWQAVAMKTMLDMSDFEEINVDIEGLCASAATFFVCTQNAHVRIAQGSEFMIHNPSTISWGTAAELMKDANRLTKMENDQHEMYAGRTGQTPEQIKQWMDAETWFTAKEAVEMGFADELMQSADAAACVGGRDMELMKEMYRHIPGEIGVRAAAEPQNNVSNAQMEATSCATENKNLPKEEKDLEIKDITMAQLEAENPALYQEIRNQGVSAERERMEQIDEMTDEGFEDLAAKAKHEGTSAGDFLKQVVAARKQKKSDFLTQRAEETKESAKVAGGASTDNDKGSTEDEISANAKEMAKMAESFVGVGSAMY